MAGDWIKLEHGILDKPEVMELSEVLGISAYEVVGHLVEFWFWCDRNLSPECPQAKGTKRGLDRVAGRDGFGDALIAVGWLSYEDGYFSVPNYDTHLSRSAKQRAKDQRKKAFQRSKLSPICPDSVPRQQGTKAGPEKRREEKSINTHTHSGGDAISDVIIPDWMADRWAAYLEAWRLMHGKGTIMPSPTQQALILRLSQLGQDKALADLAFMTERASKGYLDSSNDYQKRSNGKPKKDGLII